MGELDDEVRPQGANNLAALIKVYKTLGPNAPEFWAMVDKFIVFLQYRHMGWFDQDLQSHCKLKILESFAYYKPDKVNIGTWIYSVVRNQISSHCYHHRRRSMESPDELENIDEGVDHFRNIPIREFLGTALFNFTRLVVEDSSGRFETDFSEYDKDHPLVKAVLWELTKSGST